MSALMKSVAGTDPKVSQALNPSALIALAFQGLAENAGRIGELNIWPDLLRLDRSFLPNFLFAPDVAIVVLGQDRLVANTLKYLDGQPAIGESQSRALGWVLLPFQVDDLGKIRNRGSCGDAGVEQITMARVRLSDDKELHAVNDLFIGPKSHISARYEIRVVTAPKPISPAGLSSRQAWVRQDGSRAC